MIFSIIGIAIMIYSLQNYKKGFIFFIAFSLFLGKNITLFGIAPLSTVMALYYILLYILFYKINPKKLVMPWTIPLIFMSLSLFLSSVFSIAGFNSEVSTLVGNMLKEVLIVWVLWDILDTEQDFQFLFKYLTLVIFISCIYGILEFVLQQNVLADYTKNLVDASIARDWSYSNSLRGYRVYSIFEHPIGAGMIWGTYSFLIAYLLFNNKSELIKKRICIITAVLCVVCIFLTKMRSPIIFTFIALCSFVNFKNKKFYYIIPFVFIALMLAKPYLMNNMVVRSLFDPSAQENVGGSSLYMRKLQWEATLRVMKYQPIVGLGPSFMHILSRAETYYLMGLESILFYVPTQFGIIGIITYIIKIVYDIIIIPRKFETREFFILSIAFWGTRVITTIPGFSFILYYSVLIFLIKVSKKFKMMDKQET